MNCRMSVASGQTLQQCPLPCASELLPGSLDLRGHTRGNILEGGNHSQCVGAALFPSSARWPRLAPLLLDLALEPPCDSGDRLPIALLYGPSLDAPQSQSCCQRLYNFLKKF